MNTALIIGMVILGSVSLGWVFHHRSVRHMKPILTRLAAEKNGTVESPGLFPMPKLRFLHSGTEVEVSSASTGLAGESVRYTYAEYRLLLDTACRFYDTVTSVVPNYSKVLKDI